jgi:hypothetical protein
VAGSTWHLRKGALPLRVLTTHPTEGTVLYTWKVPAIRKDVTGCRAHPGPFGGSAGAEEDVSVSWLRGDVGTPLGTLRRQLGTSIRRGYAGQDPKARLYGLRPKRFDGMAASEADDQHREETR